MKILAYSDRNDETEYFEEFSKKYNVKVVLTEKEPSMETSELAKGFDCISIITTIIDAELVNKFHGLGVKFISTRTRHDLPATPPSHSRLDVGQRGVLAGARRRGSVASGQPADHQYPQRREPPTPLRTRPLPARRKGPMRFLVDGL